MRCGLILMLAAMCGTAALAEVQVTARLDRPQIYLGETAELFVDVNGLREVTPPELSIPGIEATCRGGSGYANTSIQMVNGQMVRDDKYGFKMQYSLRPTQAGDIPIPPVKVEKDGAAYSGNPLVLRVIVPREQDLVVLEQEAVPARGYVEQKLVVRLKIYVRKPERGGKPVDVEPLPPRALPQLEIPWFQSLADWQTKDVNEFARPLVTDFGNPGFSINNYRQRQFFDEWLIPFRPPRTTVERTRKDGTKWPYYCYTLEKEFRPVSVGTFQVPPVTFKGTMPASIDAMGRFSAQEAVITSAPAVAVSVLDVPDAGKPDSFTGAIGQYTFEVDAIPKKANVGDPIDLVLSVTGNGILEKILPPDLNKQAKLVERFRVHGDAPAVKVTDNTKTFRYTIRATSEDVKEIPPLSFSYFDVDAGEYKTLWSKPVPISVAPTAMLSMGDVLEPPGTQSHTRIGKELAEGILDNFTGSDVLDDQEFDPGLSAGFLALLVLPPLAFAGTALVQRKVTRLRTNPALVRARAARKEALARLHRIEKEQSAMASAEFCGELCKVLTAYVADKANLPREGVTAEDVAAHLRARAVDPALAEAALALVMRCDSGRFGGSELQRHHAEMIRDARDLIDKLDRRLR